MSSLSRRPITLASRAPEKRSSTASAGDRGVRLPPSAVPKKLRIERRAADGCRPGRPPIATTGGNR
jgi:hypothetical protein